MHFTRHQQCKMFTECVKLHCIALYNSYREHHWTTCWKQHQLTTLIITLYIISQNQIIYSKYLLTNIDMFKTQNMTRSTKKHTSKYVYNGPCIQYDALTFHSHTINEHLRILWAWWHEFWGFNLFKRCLFSMSVRVDVNGFIMPTLTQCTQWHPTC